MVKEKEEKKIPSLYTPGGPAAKAQAKMHNAATGLVRQFNERMIEPVTAPFKAAGQAIMQSAPVQRIKKDAARQADARAVGAANAANSTPQAEMRRAFGPPPVAAAPPTVMVAQPGTVQAAVGPEQTNMAPQQTFSMGQGAAAQQLPEQVPETGHLNVGLQPRTRNRLQLNQQIEEIDQYIAKKGPDAEFTKGTRARVQNLKEMQGRSFYDGGTDRVPVGPDGLPLNQQPQQTTQQRLEGMNQSQNTRTTSDGYTFEGAAGDAGRFFAPTGKGDPATERANQQQRVQFLNRQGFRKVDPNALPEDISRYERTRYNEQKLENQGALERTAMADRTARERNRIDEMNVQDQMGGRAIENQARQFALNEQQQVDTLRQRYMDPKTSPDEKKQISEYLRFFGKGDKESGLRTFDTTIEDVMGNKTTTPHFYDDGGYRGPAIPEGQVQQALPPRDQMVKGKVYHTQDGPRKWDGKRLVLP